MGFPDLRIDGGLKLRLSDYMKNSPQVNSAVSHFFFLGGYSPYGHFDFCGISILDNPPFCPRGGEFFFFFLHPFAVKSPLLLASKYFQYLGHFRTISY